MRFIACLCLSLTLTLMACPPAGADEVSGDLYQGLHWRLVGPFRGGWATMAAGVPGEPNTYYFGAADGGVWKTTNAGRTWRALMQHEKSAAVGAIAVAPSDPEIIYVGTGQVAARYDAAGGDGVYRSGDGGETWTNVGLNDSRHIGRIMIDPKDSDHVLVAALGHYFGSNDERGVFVSHDGGEHWKKTLFVNADTGVVDLARDPRHPDVIYAAAWQARQHPWLDYFMPQAGPGSGIYKSADGGESWRKVDGDGLPEGDMGRIGLAVPPGSSGKRVYASISAEEGGGFYRSDDGGAHWTLANTDPELASDYFARVTAVPDDPDRVYVMGRSIHVSDDAGDHFRILKGSPGGDDYHFLWINPEHPEVMVTAADQGCVITLDGGKSWSSWYNQPTGQLYHVATDDEFPYHIYGGQQDSGTVSVASRGPNGLIGPRQWHPVGGDERDFDIPKPGDANLVFGSGLGGYVSRWNATTHQVTDVSAWPVSSYGADPRKVKYRYTWITPLAFGTAADHPLYVGAQFLFRSDDDGASWNKVSPDLTGQTRRDKDCAFDSLGDATDCGFGVIYDIAASPKDPNTLWVGTDNGRVQLSRDGGGHWNQVTPEEMPAWGRVNMVEPSRFDADAAYVAVDTHRLDLHRPVLFRTTDAGAHWQSIVKGIPDDEYVSSVAADPKQAGLLFAGTNRGVYVSLDDGGSWHRLGSELPTTTVRDLTVHDNDLIAATMGRAFWSLDNIEPLREAARDAIDGPVHLFTPAPAVRLRASTNRDTPIPPSEPYALNPPTGAVIDYWLADGAKGPVSITISDARGNPVRHFSSDEPPAKLEATRYFNEEWEGKPEPEVATGAGMHRFVWDLRHVRPPAIEYQYSISSVFPGDTPMVPQGALAVPGDYTVKLTVGGHSFTAPLKVKMDPRADASNDALTAQLAFENRIAKRLEEAVSAYRQSGQYLDRLEQQGAPDADIEALKDLRDGDQDSIKSVAAVLDAVATRLELSDAAPTQGQREVFADYSKQLDELLAKWEASRER